MNPNLDPERTASQLQSALVGSLAHVTHTLLESVQADVIVAQSVGAMKAHRAQTCRPGTDADVSSPLNAWLEDDVSHDGLPQAGEPAWLGVDSNPHPLLGRLRSRVADASVWVALLPVTEHAAVVVAALRQRDAEDAFPPDHAAWAPLLQTATEAVRAGLQADLAGFGSTTQPRAMPSDDDVNQPLTTLTRTEKTVFNHLCEGLTEKQIAAAMHRSPHTVHVHVKNIYRKLGVHARSQLLARYAKTPG